MNERDLLKRYAKRGVSLFMLMGITTTIGSIQHGSFSYMSLDLALGSFGVLCLLNIPKRED